MEVSVWGHAVTIDWCQDPTGKQAGWPHNPPDSARWYRCFCGGSRDLRLSRYSQWCQNSLSVSRLFWSVNLGLVSFPRILLVILTLAGHPVLLSSLVPSFNNLILNFWGYNSFFQDCSSALCTSDSSLHFLVGFLWIHPNSCICWWLDLVFLCVSAKSPSVVSDSL